jgi:hypothetical protein
MEAPEIFENTRSPPILGPGRCPSHRDDTSDPFQGALVATTQSRTICFDPQCNLKVGSEVTQSRLDPVLRKQDLLTPSEVAVCDGVHTPCYNFTYVFRIIVPK